MRKIIEIVDDLILRRILDKTLTVLVILTITIQSKLEYDE